MQMASPGLGEKTLSLLRIDVDPDIDALVAELDDDLLALEQDIVVILDDVHAIRDPHAIEFFQRFLQHPSPRLHLVLGARRDPTLPLARLRSRGQLLEIRAADLAFTEGETRALLQNAGVSADLAESLEQRNEGWAVGIHLGALALRSQQSSERGAEEIVAAGVHDLILNDILALQPDRVQRLLLASSLVDRFTGDLCAVLLDDPDVHKLRVRPLLQEIAADGLLLYSLGGEPEWFRFHQIFREALQHELRQRVSPEALAQMHARASAWFEQAGFISEALDHALLAGKEDAAVSIIERNAQLAIAEDQWFELGHWLERLPEAVVRSRSELIMAQAWVFQPRGNHAELLSAIGRARLLLESEAPLHDADWLLARQAELHVLQVQMSGVEDDPEGVVANGETIGKLAPERFASGFGLSQMGFAIIALGQYDRLDERMRQVMAANRGADDPFSRQRELWARLLIGTVSLCVGRLAESAQMAQEVAGLAASYGLRRFAAMTCYWQGWLAYERNQLDDAIALFERAVHERATGILILLFSSFGLARALDAAGRTSEADNLMARLTARYPPDGHPQFGKAMVMAFAALRDLQRGDLDAASRWLQTVQVWKPEPEVATIDHPLLQRIRILIATDQLREADRALALVEAAATRPPVVVHFQFRVLALRALHDAVSGDRVRGLSQLRAACAMAGEAGHIRALLDLGLGSPAFQELLLQLPEDELPMSPDAIRRYYRLATVSNEPVRAPVPNGSPNDNRVYEQLTERERDVVDGLVRRLSYKEIAYELSISPLTVKSHSTHIYAKLGVSSRRQMIRLLESAPSS